MTRDEFISKVDEKIKLVRNEKGYTQDKMADILGIAKKTLINVEKGRGTLGWSTAIAACIIFKDSEILQLAFGGDTEDIILSLAYNGYEAKYEKTMGGKVWWEDICLKEGYKIQQNIISRHYRIIDKDYRRIASSFDLDYLKKRLQELII